MHVGRGVDVYILDSGIRYSHQVFGGRASFGGYDEFGGQGDDDHGHGTHCAGLAVGRLTGVAWGARVFRCVDIAITTLFEIPILLFFYILKYALFSMQVY